MAEKKIIGADDFVYVRAIYGKGPEAKQRYEHIPSGGMNQVLADWHAKQEPLAYDCSTPSRTTACPRAVYFDKHGIPATNTMGWGTEQRMMLGRQLENLFAQQLSDEGLLLWHWKDDPGEVVEKFEMGTGIDRSVGVPDYLLELTDQNKQLIPSISDAKTSRSDSFGYVPMTAPEIWKDGGWYKYKVQVDNYFMLCHDNPAWFTERGLPLPEQCHLFSYALDDGIVRREFAWKPTDKDFDIVRSYIRRFNEAITASSLPDCVCAEGDGFQQRFCRYGKVEAGAKVATSCCAPELEQVKAVAA